MKYIFLLAVGKSVMPRKSSSRSEKRSMTMPARIFYSDTSETKTLAFFCYLDFENMSFQMMYYDHEGDEIIKIVSELEDKDEEFQGRFKHWFSVQLYRHNIPDFFIERLVELL